MIEPNEDGNDRSKFTKVNPNPIVFNWDLLKHVKNASRSIYDFQRERQAFGTRIISNFKKKIGIDILVKEDKATPALKNILKDLTKEYKLLSVALTMGDKKKVKNLLQFQC